MGANTDVLVLENKISLLLKPVYNYHDRCHKNLQPSFADNSLPYVFTSALIIWLLGVGWNFYHYVYGQLTTLVTFFV